MTYTFSYFDSKNFEIFYILLHLGWPDLAAGWRGWGRQEEKATDHVGAGTADAGADRLERQAGQAGALPPGQTEPGRQSMEVDRAGRQQPDCPCAAMIRLSNFPPNNPPFCCQWVQANAPVTWLPKKISLKIPIFVVVGVSRWPNFTLKFPVDKKFDICFQNWQSFNKLKD